MRPATDINNGKTEANISTFVSRQQSTSAFELGKVFHFFLPTLFFGFCKPALAITNLAHLLLPCRQADANAKSKELNFLTRKIIVLNKFFDYFLGNKNKSSKTLALFTFASFNSYNP